MCETVVQVMCGAWIHHPVGMDQNQVPKYGLGTNEPKWGIWDWFSTHMGHL